MSDVFTRAFQDGDEIRLVRAQDAEPILESAQHLRSNGLTGSADFRHVGRIPAVVLEGWLNEAGVSFNDHKAVEEIIHRKLLDGDFAKLRVHEGRF